MMTSMAIGLSMDSANTKCRHRAQVYFDFLDTDPRINPCGPEGILSRPECLQNAWRVLQDGSREQDED